MKLEEMLIHYRKAGDASADFFKDRILKREQEIREEAYGKGLSKGWIDGQGEGVRNERKNFIEKHIPEAFEKGARDFAYWVDDKEGGFFSGTKAKNL